jgi:transcriptional regulator with XRE-family HTH domain
LNLAVTKKLPHAIDRHVGDRVRMRRITQGMSQKSLGDALGLTFQQVQKYEKGTNRIGASRLQHIASIQQVPISFFFEGAPGSSYALDQAQSPAYISDFLATPDGLALTRAYMCIQDAKLRRSIVGLVKQIAGEDTQQVASTFEGDSPVSRM